MHSHNGQRFEPDQDPYIRRWAARFNLAPDDRVVVMTATIERMCSDLSEQFSTLQHTVDERQEQWTSSLTTTNQTLQQALRLIQQQQTNQTALTQTYAQLTNSLLKFEQALNGLNTKINALPQPSATLTSDLSSIRSSLSDLKDKLNTVSDSQTTLKNKVAALRSDPPVSNFNSWGWVSIGGIIVFLIGLNVMQLFAGKAAIDQLTNEMQAVRGTANSSLIRLKRLENQGR